MLIMYSLMYDWVVKIYVVSKVNCFYFWYNFFKEFIFIVIVFKVMGFIVDKEIF